MFSLKNQANDEEGLGGKIDEDDKEALLEAVKETQDWLESNASYVHFGFVLPILAPEYELQGIF